MLNALWIDPPNDALIPAVVFNKPSGRILPARDYQPDHPGY